MPETSHNNPDFSWRHEHIGRLLFEILKDFQFRSLEKMNRLGYNDISLSSINIIASTHIEGTRLTEIAQNLNITKQAAGQMVKDLIKKGYLTSQTDPNDGRATLVTFTPKGQKLLTEVKQDIDLIEGYYAQLIGQKSYTNLKDLLMDLLDHTQNNNAAESRLKNNGHKRQ